jgi:LytS/YehU family sensor histidine kinase
VQALVETGSPRAPKLLQSLTEYLRAAVPRLDGSANTLGQELELVRAYLELMQMRMPDRLAFALHVDPTVHVLSCPPMTLLTLVENAVQHGIDPSEEGGRIDVHAGAWRRGAAACAWSTRAWACKPAAAGSAPDWRRCVSVCCGPTGAARPWR